MTLCFHQQKTTRHHSVLTSRNFYLLLAFRSNDSLPHLKDAQGNEMFHEIYSESRECRLQARETFAQIWRSQWVLKSIKHFNSFTRAFYSFFMFTII